MTTKSMTRRSFTDEFKREAVSLLVLSGRPLTQVAIELGIQPSMLRSWRSTVNGTVSQLAGTAGVSAAVAASSEQSEIRRLRRELERAQMERDILKKPSASSRSHRDEVLLHRGPSNRIPGADHVRRAGGEPQRLLRVAGSSAECPPCRRPWPGC